MQASGHSPTFRNDIEGLRAVAVLSVLANHAFPKSLPGGFAGVDIFFVISGYLIGKHLLQDIQAGRFNIFRFYASRARRIFPALALVLISVWGVGWILFSAPEFAALGRHIAAAALFSNNFLLSSESGYFDAAALEKPLLHLWSLGIEEQFYLLVPALLWVSSRGTAAGIRWVARAGAISLVAAILLSNFDYPSSFYLLHTRFWELATGVVLANAEMRVLVGSDPHRRSISIERRNIVEIQVFSISILFAAVLVLGAADVRQKWDGILADCGLSLTIVCAAGAIFLADANAPDKLDRLRTMFTRRRSIFATASSLVGIVLIGASMAAFAPVNWPGGQTVLPVLGAAALIAATPASFINSILARRPLVFIGGISYPLYLWHWPAIVIYRQLYPESRWTDMMSPLAISFVLAWLTKTCLEDPVRFGKMAASTFRRPPLGFAIAGLGLAGLLGVMVIAVGGVPSRFPPNLRAVAEWSESNPDRNWRLGRCYYYISSTSEFSGECTPDKRPGVPLILLWGDSHAAHLYPGLIYQQSITNFDIAQWTSAGCPPTETAILGELASCSGRRATAIHDLLKVHPDTILLSGGWERYLQAGSSADAIMTALAETIHALKDLGIKRIVVFGPGQMWRTSLPVDLFRFMAKNRSKEIPSRLGTVSDEIWRLDAAMAALAKAEGIQYVSVVSYFCDTRGCLTVGDKKLARPDLLYRDQDHLTVAGSKFLISHITRQLFGQ